MCWHRRDHEVACVDEVFHVVLCADTCVDMCARMCADMCIDMRVRKCADMRVYRCVERYKRAHSRRHA